MFLDDRKKRILKAIVEDYVSTGEPVGSRTIAKKYGFSLSSATIRNEMADLEEMGLLYQPHTSAGRIPSDKGYRVYVDKLMRTHTLSQKEIRDISDGLKTKLNEVDQLIKRVINILSQITKYTSIAITPQVKDKLIKRIQLVPIDESKILLIIVTNSEEVKNFIVRVNENCNNDFLNKISNMLSERLVGIHVRDVETILNKWIDSKEYEFQTGILNLIIETLKENIKTFDSFEIFLWGTANIFNYPEFNDVIKAKELISIFDQKEVLADILGITLDEKVNISIGSENCYDSIKECSLITTSYKFGNKIIGSIGVIGPTRMDYAKVISCIEYLRKEIDKLVKELD